MKPKAVMNWSGGKDSSLALYDVLQKDEVEVVALLTTVNKTFGRISMHGVRETLLEEQANTIGLPLMKVMLDDKPSMTSYENEMAKAMAKLKADGVTVSIFGDIFLEDLKKYREEKLESAGFKGLFPLWKQDTKTLTEQFVHDGFKGITSCVTADKLGEDWVGKEMNRDFFVELPENVDPCGENGEYHSFVYDGPHMKQAMKIIPGEKVYRTYERPENPDDDCPCGSNCAVDIGFWYCDLTMK
ncbi:diphthine--ammonia ligase [Poriferisphaera sp. WC338]|uniref:Dph6-related ATP pyrophosphatase n=1 Tax=Poriferisphaera sp. WC338 TaxID=3425129 RepID=UPI003D81676C